VYECYLRVIASPPVAPHVLDEAGGAGAAHGSLLASASDSDINASCVTLGATIAGAGHVLQAVAAALGPALSAGRAIRIELLCDAPDSISEEVVRSYAVALHGALNAPVYVARRDVPAAAWALSRPMPWGRKGLAVGQTAPALPFGGSECLGVAIEIGKPTVLVKARLDAVPEHGLLAACAAVGGAESGFADVGAYAAVSAADGTSVVILEFSDLSRSPLHRTLAVLDIEAARYGGRLGQVGLLSHVPLRALLDVLAARTALNATAAHVLETHLPAESQR
jgi:hypothetical protein